MALLSISVIPFGPVIEVFGHKTAMQLADLNIGVLFVLAASSLGVYGVALAGWSSNNKYSLIGGLRSSAQMISYELPLTLAIVSPLLLSNHLSFRGITDSQAGFYLGFIPRWNVFQMPFPQIFSFLVLAILFAIPVLQPVLTPLFWFLSKVGSLLFLYIWVRGTLPRFRYDQLMHFAWTFLFPCALINLLLTAFCVAVF